MGHKPAPFRLVIALQLSVELVHQDAIFINDRTKDQVCSPYLNELVAIRASLVEASGCTNSEDGLPGAAPCQAIVQLVCKLDVRLIILIVRIVKEASIREPGEISECLQVLEDSLAHTEDKELNYVFGLAVTHLHLLAGSV